MKKCINCNLEKDISSYYKHKQMADGHLNKCKDCCKKQQIQRHHEKSKDPEWVESERKRSREKYDRLGYVNKQKVWDGSKPWKKTSTYRNLSRDLNVQKGFECHHWSYNEKHLKSVFILKTKVHRQAHQFLIFDENHLMYRTKQGVLLDSKEKHEKYLIDIGVLVY